mgnify:CR=1 FL=1
MFVITKSRVTFAFMTTDLLERYETSTAEEIRAMARRRMIKNRQISAYLGVSEVYVSRRMLNQVHWNISEIAALAVFFNCELSDLLPKELPHLDSNQKPFDSLFQNTPDAPVLFLVPRNVRFDRTNLKWLPGHVA